MPYNIARALTARVIPRPRRARAGLRLLTLDVVILWTQEQLHAYLAHLFLVRLESGSSLILGLRLLLPEGRRRPHERRAVLRRLQA